MSLRRLLGCAGWLTAVCIPAAAQNFEEIRVEKAVDKLHFAEGPAWSHEGWLIFCDVPSNRILKFVPGEGAQLYRDNSNGASGNAIDAQGRLYTC